MTDFRWEIQERMLVGDRNREWKSVSILNVETEEEARAWFAEFILDPEPEWQSRLVKTYLAHKVLMTESLRGKRRGKRADS